jgi:hypothetical protein
MNQKIDVGRVIEGIFEIYRDYAAVLLPVAAALFVVEAILSGLVIEVGWWLFPVSVVVQILITALYAGMVVTLVSDVQDGRRDATVEQLFKSVGPVVLPLIGAGIVAGIGIGIGFFLLIVPGLILLTIWAVFAPAVVLERAGVLQSLGRSRELVRGNGWQVFGVIVIIFLIAAVVSAVFSAIGAAIADLVGRIILDYIGTVLTAPLTALVAAVLYFNLRAAKGEAAPPGGQLDATGAAGGVGPAGGAGAVQPPPGERQQPAQPTQPQQAPPTQPQQAPPTEPQPSEPRREPPPPPPRQSA